MSSICANETDFFLAASRDAVDEDEDGVPCLRDEAEGALQKAEGRWRSLVAVDRLVTLWLLRQSWALLLSVAAGANDVGVEASARRPPNVVACW